MPFFIIWDICTLKNGIINLVIILFTILSWIFIHPNHHTVFGITIGIIGSALASFNLIDGYNVYKIKVAKITIISNLLSETSIFLNIILDLIGKVLKKEIERLPDDSEEKRFALKITGLQLSAFNCGDNLKYETVEKLEKIFALFCKFCKKVNLRDEIINFDNARIQFRKIESIITSYWAMINDESLINSYTELMLAGSDLNESYQYEDVIEVGNDMNTLRANFYMIINCYKSLLRYKTIMQNYTEPRRKKYFGFIADSLNKEVSLED